MDYTLYYITLFSIIAISFGLGLYIGKRIK